MIIWFFDDSLYSVVNHENQTVTKSHHFNNDDSLLCAGHSIQLGGESPLWGSNLQPLVEDKGVHREVESEGSPRQISGLKHMKFIRQITTDKSAKQDKIQMVT